MSSIPAAEACVVCKQNGHFCQARTERDADNAPICFDCNDGEVCYYLRKNRAAVVPTQSTDHEDQPDWEKGNKSFFARQKVKVEQPMSIKRPTKYNGARPLPEEIKQQIRAEPLHMSHAAIAKKYDVSLSTVWVLRKKGNPAINGVTATPPPPPSSAAATDVKVAERSLPSSDMITILVPTGAVDAFLLEALTAEQKAELVSNLIASQWKSL